MLACMRRARAGKLWRRIQAKAESAPGAAEVTHKIVRPSEKDGTVHAFWHATAPLSPPAAGPPAEELDLEGRYEDRGLLGRGGMGAVRRMRDLKLRRDVAAKMLDPRLAAHRDQVQAFIEEAQVTAQLEHPNIVPVHELGVDRRGSVYFTMKTVRGETLQDLLLHESRPPGSSERLTAALEVFLKVCDAVAFAHSHGVLHLDIKPSNVMVGAFGEAYLMDWGLARIRVDHPGSIDIQRPPGAAGNAAKEGTVGTPAYMAPEMARGGISIDERTDVFGLGAILYQIVTGRAPYQGATSEDVLRRARRCQFTVPDEVDDVFVPARLARIVARAMERDPTARHASARELAGEVREFLHRGHHLPRQTFPAGSCIVRQGESGGDAYVITRGRCEAYKITGGERRTLREMGPGAIFGELSLVSSLPRSACVDAVTEVTVLVLTRDNLADILAPDTLEGLLTRSLVDRFRELDEKFTALASK
jgi:tRNA A-37 threonylcarbamoyl transferase component Bud32